MKSFIFCTSCMRPDIEFHQMRRYQRWINYYRSLMNELNADKLFLIDDGGTYDAPSLNVLYDFLPDKLTEPVNVYRFNDNLGRNSNIDYPGWWRSFLFSYEIAKKYSYDKIIHIESDFFILSPKLKEFVRNTSHGWNCLYSQHFDFPESALQVICQDSYHLLDKLQTTTRENSYKAIDCAEKMIPFTNIEKTFIGDRIGEDRVFAAWMDKHIPLMNRLDYIAQVHIRSQVDA